MRDPDYALFAEIVAAGSLSAAARRMGVSPAMVSKRLAALEHRLGVALVHRTTRRLSLTARGESFHQDITTILASVEAAEARVRGVEGRPAGPLRLSAPTSFGRLHLAPHLTPFLDAHPEVRLTLDLSDGFSDLVGERIDLALRIAAAIPPGLEARRLATSRRILCAAPAYLAANGRPESLKGLSDHRLLAAEGQTPWRLTGPRGPRDIAIDSHVRTNSSEVVRELAAAGLGIALRSLWDVSDDLAAGRLVRVLEDVEGSSDVGVYAVRPRGVPTAATLAMSDYLAALYAAPSWES